jgi:hypothetical protein
VSTVRRAARAAAVAAILVLGVGAVQILRGSLYVWLPGYVRDRWAQRPEVRGIRHVLFVFVDHYEPGRGEEGVVRNREWLAGYRQLADRHRDSYGRRPVHSWFYACEQHNDAAMRELSRAVNDGYGEIEFHFHHGGDTNATFPGRLADGLAWFNSHGAMIDADRRVTFGFIHGNWSLDDAKGPKFCGVSRELDILKQAGAYADFTFPAPPPSQPRTVNRIYYARDDDGPKSYDSGVEAAVGAKNDRDLLIVEGPTVVRLQRGPLLSDLVDEGAVEDSAQPRDERVDGWIAAGIGVRGRPEWLFVKVYTHGIQARRTVLSDATDRMFSHLEEQYGRGPYRLHYLTAREAYNVVRAAEDGMIGDPDAYRDYVVKPPLNSTRAWTAGHEQPKDEARDVRASPAPDAEPIRTGLRSGREAVTGREERAHAGGR